MKSLVFVHGFMGDPSDWDFVNQEFPEYQITTPLLRPAEDWDAGLSQLAQELPPDSIVVGYSMGARLSLGLAVNHPERVRALIFCSGNPGIEQESLRDTRFRHDLAIAEEIETSERMQFLHRWYDESTVFKSLPEHVREDEIRRKSTRSSDDWSAILRCYSVAQQPNYWPELRELNMPVLAMAGTEDRKYARYVARMGQFPSIDVRIIPACGHIVHREQPHVFLHLVRDFLQRVV